MHFKRFLILLFSIGLISSCFLSKPIKTGDVYFAEKKYTVAADAYKGEIESEKTDDLKTKKTFLVAECYRLSNNTKEAERYYEKAVDMGYAPIAIYHYAEMLKTNGKYAEAIKQFEIYEKRDPSNEDLAESEVKACNRALEWQKHPSNYRVNNVDDLNSDAFDYAPVLYENGSIVFTSDRKEANGSETYGWTGEKFSDFFIASSNGKGGFNAPLPFSPVINSKYNEGAGCFTKTLNEFYFTRCGSDGTNSDYCKIYVSYKDANGAWSAPQIINLFDDSVNVSQPFISADGKELYVSADAKEGYGGKDIYVCDRTPDGWGNPINMGAIINSPGDEGFPYISDDGKFYFASSGHESMGGYDIFYSTKSNGQWGIPVNMKYPINTSYDDFGIIFEKLKPGESDSVRAKGYLTSSRPGGKGEDDIYHFILPRIKVCLLNVLVQEKILENPADPNSKVIRSVPLSNADVNIAEIDDSGSPVLSSVQTLKSDSTGKFVLTVNCEKNYKIIATKQDYFSKTEFASTNGFSKIDADTSVATAKLELDKIRRNVFYNIPNIYYGLDSANIRPDAARVLDSKVITLLKDNPTIKVEIGSHTDSRASFEYNMKLSQRRAQSVVNYLVAHGIDKDRLTAKGYSFSMLTNKCGPGVECTEEEHQANRRTTFQVIGEVTKGNENQ